MDIQWNNNIVDIKAVTNEALLLSANSPKRMLYMKDYIKCILNCARCILGAFYSYMELGFIYGTSYNGYITPA